ncbi:hypothetical protein [Prosthecobacter sp.]
MNAKSLPGGVTDRVLHGSVAFLILLLIGSLFLMPSIWPFLSHLRDELWT